MNAKKYIMTIVSALMCACAARAQVTLSMENFHLVPGETRTVEINMTNNVDIRAFQVLVDLPDNVRMVARPVVCPKRKGVAVSESGDKVEAVKSLGYKLKENGDCMIVVNAADAVPFAGSEGAVITLTLQADERSPERSEEIRLQDMELVYADGVTSVRPEDRVCTVDICSEVTSLKALMKTHKGDVDVYTLNGIKVRSAIPLNKVGKELPRGVYVIEGVKVYVNK